MNLSESPSTAAQRKRRRKVRFRLLLGAAAVLVIAVLILTPPLVNVNRYRRRITTVMSESLGRPVHLDNVRLHLLPVPGLTLENLVVSEDPAFGYEPTIRANTVEATLRASSLWRRQVEFSSVRFVDPSVNLVRDTGGRWNIESVLMQASRMDTAPTAQRKAGPAPRFPYIEATGARVNIKLGAEKMPFSLTEAQLALWLPSPQEWRVRLRGRPTRTDSNVPQAGELRLEGSLHRAATMAQVPLDLQGEWRGAPLGEASRLLTGDDAGWRGTEFFDAHVVGRLSSASVTTHLQLNDLRRADFVPAQPLDITVNCGADSDVAKGTFANLRCVAPVNDTVPLELTTPSLDLQAPRNTPAKIAVKEVPLSWVLGWAKLFVPQMPAALEPKGTVAGELDWNSATAGWQGKLTASLPSPSSGAAPSVAHTASEGPSFVFSLDTSPQPPNGPYIPILRLAPAALHLSPAGAFMLSGQADPNRYQLQLTGNGTAAQALALANTLPPLNEDLSAALPAFNQSGTPHPIAIECTRVWGMPQICRPLAPAQPAKPARNSHRRSPHRRRR